MTERIKRILRRRRFPWSKAVLACLGAVFVLGLVGLRVAAQGPVPPTSGSGSSYVLLATPETTHLGFFSADLPPVLKVKSGDTVTFSTFPNVGEEARPGRSIEELVASADALAKERNLIGPHSLTGPVYVEGAQPGDVLEIKVKDVVPSIYAGQIVFPGERNLGLLPEEFAEGTISHLYVDLSNGITQFAQNVTLPVKPFMGIMGVAPPKDFEASNSEAGGAWEARPERIDSYEGIKRVSSVPPDLWGGNMDNKEMVAGTSLFVPVFNEGALFSTGDGHVNQANGEVGLTASETAMRSVTLQFVVHKDMDLIRPVAETPDYFMTMGFDPDVDTAMKIATRDMLDLLVKSTGLSRLQAYSLASLAMDLNITQVVDINRGVHALVPKSIFSGYTPVAQLKGAIQTALPATDQAPLAAS
ncbi:MAG TPA: acetamidase/formamidase family protein [Trichocoleus sp.]